MSDTTEETMSMSVVNRNKPRPVPVTFVENIKDMELTICCPSCLQFTSRYSGYFSPNEKKMHRCPKCLTLMEVR